VGSGFGYGLVHLWSRPHKAERLSVSGVLKSHIFTFSPDRLSCQGDLRMRRIILYMNAFRGSASAIKKSRS
jgi:hypothetical protein